MCLSEVFAVQLIVESLCPLVAPQRTCLCVCSSSWATRTKRSAPSTPWMTVRPSRCSPPPPPAPGPGETRWTETGSCWRTSSPSTSPLLHPPPPPLHSQMLLVVVGQQLQVFPPPPLPLSFRTWTFHWTTVRTTFPRWPSSRSSSSSSRKRRRSSSRRSTVPCQDWMVSGRMDRRTAESALY